jgi:hypothetical protein
VITIPDPAAGLRAHCVETVRDLMCRTPAWLAALGVQSYEAAEARTAAYGFREDTRENPADGFRCPPALPFAIVDVPSDGGVDCEAADKYGLVELWTAEVHVLIYAEGDAEADYEAERRRFDAFHDGLLSAMRETYRADDPNEGRAWSWAGRRNDGLRDPHREDVPRPFWVTRWTLRLRGVLDGTPA